MMGNCWWRARVLASTVWLAGSTAAAGTYLGLEPGISTRAEVERALGAPIREIEVGRSCEYDPRGSGRRILVRYRARGSLVEWIELEPDRPYERADYYGWFELGEPTAVTVDEAGRRVEYHLVQGVSLHFDGPDERAPVVFFRHFDRDLFVAGGDGGDAPPSPSGEGRSSTVTGRRAEAGVCAGILGSWRWFNGAMVECSDDGRCAASNGWSGPWRCLGPGRFEIAWSLSGQAAQYVDTVQLSTDGWELSGANQAGHRAGGQRPEFSGGEPELGCRAILGSWRWHNGAQIECTADRTCISSHDFSGPWRCLNDMGRFEIRWGRPGQPDQFIDTFVISPLGSYLVGRNQHGVALSAVRE